MCKGWYTCHGVDEECPVHECIRNHDGSSGSMEPRAVSEMVKRLDHKEHVVVDALITDDDSSMKAKLKWSNAHHMATSNLNTTDYPMVMSGHGNWIKCPDNGGLPKEMQIQITERKQ